MYIFKTYQDAPELVEEADEIIDSLLPKFLFTTSKHNLDQWLQICQEFSTYQVMIVDEQKGRVIGTISSVPVSWHDSLDNFPENGWDWAFSNPSLNGNWHCTLLIDILPEYRGQGLAKQALLKAKHIGQTYRHKGTLIPVRPTHKAEFPYLPMKIYVEKRRNDGKIYDPWLRLHLENGGQLVKICHRAMTVKLPLTDWYRFNAKASPYNSNELIVPGGLVPVTISPEQNIGIYEEPNVLILHT
jgi:GNAT superfamily N-acetyltransferase